MCSAWMACSLIIAMSYRFELNIAILLNVYSAQFSADFKSQALLPHSLDALYKLKSLALRLTEYEVVNDRAIHSFPRNKTWIPAIWKTQRY